MANKKAVKIVTLLEGVKSVNVEATIIEIGETRKVVSKRGNETFTVADASIFDDSGSITLVLWNDQIKQFSVGDKIKIEYGYVTRFKNELQLNVGKYGLITKVQEQ